MKRLALLVFLATGCVATSTAVRGPDGQMSVAVDCKNAQSNCWEEAAWACPFGYDIHRTGGAYTSGFVANQSVAVSSSDYRGDLLIRCHQALASETWRLAKMDYTHVQAVCANGVRAACETHR